MSRPRIAVAGLQHETNTFSPLPTTLADFERAGAWPALLRGDAVPGGLAGLNLPAAGFLAAAEGFDVAPVLWAAAEPGGTVEEDAFEALAGAIVDGVTAARPDGVYLDLHGAMVTAAHDDAEAELLARIRHVLGDVPLAISLDLHANVSPELASRASAIALYRTYPHVDLAETGARAAALLARVLRAPLATARRAAPFLVPITEQSTRREPGGSLYAAIPRIEAEAGAVSLDLAMGFPPADIPHVGPCAVAHAETQPAADAAADALLAALTAAAPRFEDPLIPAAEAVAAALASETHPVVIADPQDNPGAGAPGDATGLLAALLAAGAPAAMALFWDPRAAALAHEAGPGTEIDVALGGFHAPTGGPPIRARATVERLHDGRIPLTGPMYRGAVAELGPMALLRIGPVRVIVSSRRAQNADLALFRALGVAPEAERILAVKSAVHFLAAYEPIAARILFAEAPGANPCRLGTIPYTRLRPGVRR